MKLSLDTLFSPKPLADNNKLQYKNLIIFIEISSQYHLEDIVSISSSRSAELTGDYILFDMYFRPVSHLFLSLVRARVDWIYCQSR